jgi:hypothetical protein
VEEEEEQEEEQEEQEEEEEEQEEEELEQDTSSKDMLPHDTFPPPRPHLAQFHYLPVVHSILNPSVD